VGTLGIPAGRFTAAIAVSAIFWSVSTTAVIYLAVLAVMSLSAWQRSPRTDATA
jgi:hypothetical protein